MIISLLVALIYLPLIHFLRRPDLSALYLSPRPNSLLGLYDTTSPQPDIPPWERLSFPNFAAFGLISEHDIGSRSMALSKSSGATTMGSLIPLSLAVPFIPLTPPASVHLSDGPKCSSHSMERASMQSDATLVTPSLQITIHDSIDRQPSISSLRPFGSSHSQVRKGRLATPTGCMCDETPKDLDSETGKDFASFRGMLDYVPCPRHSASGGGESGNDRSSTPAKESLASFMKRRTSSLLLWFPLTVGDFFPI